MVFIVQVFLDAISLTIGREHFNPDISTKVSDIIVNENETDEYEFTPDPDQCHVCLFQGCQILHSCIVIVYMVGFVELMLINSRIWVQIVQFVGNQLME